MKSETSFLADHHNHTGYTQTIRETTYDDQGNVVKTIDYTFGQDEITQRVVDTNDQGQVTNDQLHVFGHDGHGSVRVLYDTAATIAQVFTFAAYGEMIALHNAVAQSIAVTNRLSSLGYSGEHFDAKASQQYLRARFYNPTNGRFNRLDPYTGNMQDPQSLHKYAYVHGDPIGNLDPTGKFSIGGRLAVGAIAGAIAGAAFAVSAGGNPNTIAVAAGIGAAIGVVAVLNPFLAFQVFGQILIDLYASLPETVAKQVIRAVPQGIADEGRLYMEFAYVTYQDDPRDFRGNVPLNNWFFREEITHEDAPNYKLRVYENNATGEVVAAQGDCATLGNLRR
ncbi:RHS repeat-associated core domain-containing protein [Stieleria varia]|uniref:RHS repeat-associated core domain-containing protein n=1 Tax=Stieleria varia TaxID=2528005 RepID=UPI0018D236A4|nr:RHS repeat-associated core domain-containing protein [Stieleria varia]